MGALVGVKIAGAAQNERGGDTTKRNEFSGWGVNIKSRLCPLEGKVSWISMMQDAVVILAREQLVRRVVGPATRGSHTVFFLQYSFQFSRIYDM